MSIREKGKYISGGLDVRTGPNEEFIVESRCRGSSGKFSSRFAFAPCQRGRIYPKKNDIDCNSSDYGLDTLEEYFVDVEWKSGMLSLPKITKKRIRLCEVLKKYQKSSLYDGIRHFEKGEFVKTWVEAITVSRNEKGKSSYIFKLESTIFDDLGEDTDLIYSKEPGYQIEMEYERFEDLLIITSDEANGFFFDDEIMHVSELSTGYDVKEGENPYDVEHPFLVEDYTFTSQFKQVSFTDESTTMTTDIVDMRTIGEKMTSKEIDELFQFLDISVDQGSHYLMLIVVIFGLMIVVCFISVLVVSFVLFVWFKKKRKKEEEDENDERFVMSSTSTSSNGSFDSLDDETVDA